MEKYAVLPFLLVAMLTLSCSQENNKSIRLGVEQTVKIPVEYVSISASIQLSDSIAAVVEKQGYNKLSNTVNLLENLGYKDDDLEINSGEVVNRSYRDNETFEYRAYIYFDVHDLNKIDAIRRALLNNGVNSFDISSYNNSNEDSLYTQAYRNAIQKAKVKADELLHEQPTRIGKVLSIRENVREVVKVSATAQNADVVTMNLDANLSLEPVAPLFKKQYYNKNIEFSIEFELE